jgi:hypothetical protein
MKISDLPSRINKTMDDFVKGLSGIYGEELIAVILYGSAASGEYFDKRSNINIAVILEDAGLRSVSRSVRLIGRCAFRQIHPVFFTEKYLKCSADVFPIELLDMKENRVVLHGRDVVRNIDVDIKNLRFQCEQELKAKLIGIKTAYINNRSPRLRKELLFKFFTSSLHILRNLLRLKGAQVPYAKADIISELSKKFEELNAEIFTGILAAKEEGRKPSAEAVDNMLFGFYDELEKLSEKIDRM